MKTLKRSVRGVSAVLVAVVLLFGAKQASASANSAFDEFCPGTCPPYTGGMEGTCWDYCAEFPGYVGGDCDPIGQCCCVSK